MRKMLSRKASSSTQQHDESDHDTHHDYNSTTSSSLKSPTASQLSSSTPREPQKEVIIPEFRVLSARELNSPTFGTQDDPSPEYAGFANEPGGIPLNIRVRLENLERWGHDQERGITKSKRSTRSTYLDAPCYDPELAPDAMESVAHHVPTDPRGNYLRQKDKVLSYGEFGRYEFCICHRDSNYPMIMCENCQNWFHMPCVHFDDAAEGLHTNSYFCPNCLEYNNDIMITMKKGFVPRKLPYIRLPRYKSLKLPTRQHFYIPGLVSNAPKRGRKRKAETLSPNRKLKRRRTSLPENHETLWDPHATRIDDALASQHYACDIYDTECKKPYKKYLDHLLECNVCHRTAHTCCPEHNLDHLTQEHRAIWCCNDCKACWECQRGDSNSTKGVGLLCDKCDRMFHVKCHKPPVKRIPGLHESWVCGYCTAADPNHVASPTDDSPYLEDESSAVLDGDYGGSSDSYCDVCSKQFATPYALHRHETSIIHKTTLLIRASGSAPPKKKSARGRRKSSGSRAMNKSIALEENGQLPMDDELYDFEHEEPDFEEGGTTNEILSAPNDDTPAKHTRSQLALKK